MLLRGHQLEQEKHEALQAPETQHQQATPLDVDVEPFENEDTNDEQEPETTTTLEEPTEEVLMKLQEKQCKKWKKRNNYPAGITCALLGDQLSRNDGLEVYAMPINDLRKLMVSTRPEGRKWNEKAFIKALKKQSDKGRLYRVNNTFSVSLSYIMEDSQKYMERKSGPRSEGSKTKHEHPEGREESTPKPKSQKSHPMTEGRVEGTPKPKSQKSARK
jgi:hypothetical protein